MNVVLAENWNRNSWANWTNQNNESDLVNTVLDLNTQNHLDLATFIANNELVTYSLSSVGSSIGYQSTLGYYPICILNVDDTATAQITYTTPISLTSLQGGNLLLSLPNFPHSQVNLSSSYIKLISGSENVELTFASSLHNPAAVDAYGNSYLEYAWGSFDSLGALTSIVISVTSTANINVNLAALRLVDPDWVVSNIDYNNLDLQLSNCFPIINYDLISVPVLQYTPSINDIATTIWRCSNPPGENDPLFINGSFGVRFNTGEINNTNTFTIYLRGSENVPVLESTLDGTLLTTLDGRPEPFTTPTTAINSFWVGCTVTWLNNSTSAHPIDSETVYQYQIQITNSLGLVIYQFDSFASNGAGSESPGVYMWNGVSPNTEYELIFNLEDDVTRAIICPVGSVDIEGATSNTYGYLGYPIFDSGLIKDTSTFFREPGRLGFFAEFGDPNVFIKHVRPYHTVFGQFLSATYQSLTPANGAQIYSNYTNPSQLFGTNPDNPLWTTLIGIDDDSQPNTPVISQAATYTKVGFPYSSTGYTDQAWPGAISQTLTPFGDDVSGIVDFNNLNISLSIMPNALMLQGNLTLILVNSEGYGIELLLPPLVAGNWNNIDIIIPEAPTIVTQDINDFFESSVSTYKIASGLYKLAFLFAGPAGAELSIANEQVTQNAATWFMRGVSPNPYDQYVAPWTPVDQISYAQDSVQFTPPRDAIQVRLDALQQDTQIYNGFAVSPTYAQLGKITPNVSTKVNLYNFGSIAATLVSGLTYRFNATSPSGPTPINYVWDFGDGHLGTGNNIEHTYNITGYPQVQSLTVFVTAYDYFGNVTTGMTIVNL